MSFLDNLREAAKDMGAAASGMFGNLANEAVKFKIQSMMEGTMAACALVSFANGSIKTEEKSKMKGYIVNSDALKIYDQAEVMEKFEEYIKKLSFDYPIGEVQCLQSIQKITKRSDAAELLVKVCCSIAAADGDFDNKEKAVVKKICSALDLNYKDFIS